MKTVILSTALLCSGTLWADFNFGECSGSGTFAQHIDAYGTDTENAVVVGTIPKGIQGLKVTLSSDKDVDIRLYVANNKKIVHWPSGILNKGSKETKAYKGVDITYSGYNGTKGELGHEFIEVDGSTPTEFTTKVFGYRGGDVIVAYSWTGKDGCSIIGSGSSKDTVKSSRKGNNVIPPVSNSTMQAYLQIINAARAIPRSCGQYGYFPAVGKVSWSDKLYKAAYEHSQDMTRMNYFSHTGSGAESDWSGYALQKQSSPGDRIKHYNFNWTRYSENIIAGTVRDTAEKVINSWLNSPGHCKNIMDPNVTKVGLAHTQSNNTQYTHYWTQDFGRGN